VAMQFLFNFAFQSAFKNESLHYFLILILHQMNNEISETLKIQRIISTIILIVGTILMVFMIKLEDEPEAIPLILITTGAIWLAINRYQTKKTSKKSGKYLVICNNLRCKNFIVLLFSTKGNSTLPNRAY
jgi:uncharacterized membrane protein YidH (DUF202 family)